jgi:hypothetical protein
LDIPQSRAIDIAGNDTTIQVHRSAQSCVMGMEVGAAWLPSSQYM